MQKPSKQEEDGENQWISISDLMSVLMMIFLFIAISYMVKVTEEKNKIKEIAVTYNKLQTALYQDLLEEFKDDLIQWNAKVDSQTLAIQFLSPDVLFAAGSAILQPKFKVILDDFFPRYIKILTNEKYRKDIEEIRIEGHTSSEGSFQMNLEEAYFYNMELSQNRTRRVLKYVMELENANNDKDWIKDKLTANGLSSSKIILNNGIEDKEKSRRVEFRARTNAEYKMIQILQAE